MVTTRIVVVAYLATTFIVGGLAHAEDVCSIARAHACAVTTAEDFRGAIIVPGSDEANRIVARANGCEGCVWTLVPDCDRNAVSGPAYVNCTMTRCPEGTLFRLYLQRDARAEPAYVDTICISRTQRVVTPAMLGFDAERHLTRLAPPVTTIAVQPEHRAIVGLATYFIASGPATDTTTIDVTTAAGVRARLDIGIQRSSYRWDFGDGASCVTEFPGGTYAGGPADERCDDRVAHVYRITGPTDVQLRATWSGTYTFDVGFGHVGPLPVPGNGVTGPAETRSITISEARAELIGGEKS